MLITIICISQLLTIYQGVHIIYFNHLTIKTMLLARLSNLLCAGWLHIYFCKFAVLKKKSFIDFKNR